MLIQKILIIDDDPDVVETLRGRMESFGFETFTYSSMENALQGLHTTKPDLILMELGYSQTRGMIFLNKIREHLRSEDNLPPVIVVNSEKDFHMIEYAFDMGTMECFTIPYQNMPLGNAITDYLPNEEDVEIVPAPK